ncbi:MAG: CvpA family protein [Gammaproteobacteria bacterium]|nr:CvpA family protein [Gammaproteobacteria bacterium]
MHTYNMIDKLILAVFFFSGLMGTFRGGVREVVSLLSWLAGFIVAALFSHPVAAYFSQTGAMHSLTATVSTQLESDASQQMSMVALGTSFCVLFFGTVFIGSLIGRFANSVVEGAGISLFNRLFGGIFGLGRGFLVILVFIFIVQMTEFANQELWTDSSIVKSYQPAVRWFGNLVQPHIDSLRNKVSTQFGGFAPEDHGHSQSTGLPP